MELFPEIDKNKTRENVHRLLSEYRTMARLSDEEFTPKITATYSLEMKAPGGISDNVSRAVLLKDRAEKELWKIGRALNKLNADQRRMLYDRYIDRREMSDIQIYMNLGMSEATYYRELGRAQMSFAEAYDGGRLLSEK